MRYFIAIAALVLDLFGGIATAHAGIVVRVPHGHRPVEVRTPTLYQAVGHFVGQLVPGTNEPRIYELRRIRGRSRRAAIPSDGWVEFSSGRDKERLFVIDPRGLVGNLYLVSENDPAFRRNVYGPKWHIKVPNRPGGPIQERYFLVLEYQNEQERRIFEFTVCNSAPPDLDGTRW